ncbi:hypothetical protein DdX_17982 [Ditylenchus destructor]|uniref:Uncharacterized protein n=1 Tax=Ditylenchus destructor TaxID=166010 RepID=A0AAD4MM18_9BILA|nr:hypothetical protein DdX_17982 [Ditylenchus destructor]
MESRLLQSTICMDRPVVHKHNRRFEDGKCESRHSKKKAVTIFAMDFPATIPEYWLYAKVVNQNLLVAFRTPLNFKCIFRSTAGLRIGNKASDQLFAMDFPATIPEYWLYAKVVNQNLLVAFRTPLNFKCFIPINGGITDRFV